MAVKFTDTPCRRSKTERPCVLKHITSTAIGEGTVRQIWGCRRCGEKSYDNISVDKAECALSSSSKHQWVTTENLYFKQHQRYREIHDRQECLCCGAVRNYEYQSMMVALTGMDVSNASVYDGASGLAEAVLMSIRANKKNKSGRVLIAQTVHPHYTQTTRNIVQNQNVVIEALPMGASGVTDLADLAAAAGDSSPGALVIQQPNFFGRMEDVDALTDWAHERDTLVIAVVNPMSLGVLKPPSEWGTNGADIVCGDGQPFGVPMASGGPSFGFICSRKEFMRQLPGRIIGKTEDLDGRTGYALTLQAREQHIRRGKATSNICTNQGLLVTAGTIYMSLMGPQGIRETAITCHRRATELQQRLLQIDGVEEFFPGPFFHEFALRLPVPAVDVVQAMMTESVLPGLVLSDFSDGNLVDAEHGLLIAVTEKRTNAEIEKYVAVLTRVLQGITSPANPQAGN